MLNGGVFPGQGESLLCVFVRWGVGGVPGPPHVSSADPVQDLHADQALQKEPVCSDIPAAPFPLTQEYRVFRAYGKNSLTDNHTHPLKPTLLQTNRKNWLNRDGLALLEERKWGWFVG